MTDPGRRPSRLLVRLLRFVSSPDAANAAVGDMLEDLDPRRAAGRAARWPALSLNGQIVRAVFACAIAALPRVRRTGGHILRDAARAPRGGGGGGGAPADTFGAPPRPPCGGPPRTRSSPSSFFGPAWRPPR